MSPTEPEGAISQREKDDLALSVQQILRSDLSAAQIAKALGIEDKEIFHLLKKQRRQMALLLYLGIAPDVYEFTRRYYNMLRGIIEEMEARIADKDQLAEMPTNTLIKLHETIMKWVGPMNQAIILDPPESLDPDPKEDGRGMSQQNIYLLIKEAHGIQSQLQQEMHSRGLPYERDAAARRPSARSSPSPEESDPLHLLRSAETDSSPDDNDEATASGRD